MGTSKESNTVRSILIGIVVLIFGYNMVKGGLAEEDPQSRNALIAIGGGLIVVALYNFTKFLRKD
jgi:hypothetical protein